jgi:hypothetical protein
MLHVGTLKGEPFRPGRKLPEKIGVNALRTKITTAMVGHAHEWSLKIVLAHQASATRRESGFAQGRYSVFKALRQIARNILYSKQCNI